MAQLPWYDDMETKLAEGSHPFDLPALKLPRWTGKGMDRATARATTILRLPLRFQTTTNLHRHQEQSTER